MWRKVYSERLSCVSKQCPADGVWRIWQGSVSRHGWLDMVKKHMGLRASEPSKTSRTCLKKKNKKNKALLGRASWCNTAASKQIVGTFVNSGVFSLGKQARFTLNFCFGMPLRKVHEPTFLWFGLPGPLLTSLVAFFVWVPFCKCHPKTTYDQQHLLLCRSNPHPQRGCMLQP